MINSNKVYLINQRMSKKKNKFKDFRFFLINYNSNNKLIIFFKWCEKCLN
jgi:hypothetical protein